jgi:hypothetical protein
MNAPISFPPAPLPRVISFAVTGQVVQVRNIADVIEPMIVLSRCDRSSGLYCVTHQIGLANLGQAEIHVEQGGDHELIRWCRRHGVPEAAEPGDLEWATRLQQMESGL